MAFIYLINELDTNNYKIGLTKSKTVEKRQSNLQTGNANELMLIREYKTKYPSKLEKMLHMHFANKRGVGEWFVLEDSDVFNFLSVCDKLNSTIEFLIENNEFYN